MTKTKPIQYDLKEKIAKKKTNNSNNLPRPFLKWAGGKGQLLNELTDRLPKTIKEMRKIDTYIEPFVGGGAFFFFLKKNFNIKNSILIDVNRELVVGYKAIKKNPIKLIQLLKKLQNNYLAKSEEKRKKFFYEIKENYNKQMKDFDYENYNDFFVKRASYLIFLNKTCFNGLFRLNKKGEFNVPFGRYKNPKICDENNILAVSKALQDTKLYCDDFTKSTEYIHDNVFIYLDPPYRPLNSTSNFTSYSTNEFSDSDQKRLADFYRESTKKGAWLMLSNSDPKNENPNDVFFDELYQNFKIKRVKANRMINCNANGRGKINELIITNY